MSAPELKDTTQDLAKKIKSLIKIDDKGVATIEKDYYQTHLPDGVTVDAVKALQQYNTDIVAAGALAFGEVAVEAMKKDKDLKIATMHMPTVGKDGFEWQIDRSYQARNPSTGQSDERFGRISVKHETYATEKKGQFAAVKTHLADLAMKSLGK